MLRLETRMKVFSEWSVAKSSFSKQNYSEKHLSEWRVCETWLFLPTFCLMWDPGTRSTCVPACSVTQSCLTLCDPMDCSPPGSSVHGILQARILEWVAISYSRGSSWPRDWTWVSCISCIGRQILHHCATWEAIQPVFLNFPNLTEDWLADLQHVSMPQCGPWSYEWGSHVEWARETWKVKVTQSCLTLWDPVDYTGHGILQARILE